MAETNENTTEKTSLLDSFMSAGKITVFESGLERPDHLQDRPFMGLAQKGTTTFFKKGDKPDSITMETAEELAKNPAFKTEGHEFLETMEKRFRSVMPGVTIFIIDPDAVQGRYLMDQEADRSLNKSLYMFVEDKLQKASAGNDQTFLTQEEILNMVNEGGITDRNPFSMRAAVAPTQENLAGLGNVNLVIGDNPDAMNANVLDMVIGAEDRRLAEGITFNEFRRLVLYHELGHATDHNYASAQNSMEKIAETPLDNVMARHRTECIADAHAVMQLARDFGTTRCAELWSDCRIEYLRMSIDRRMEDTKYDSEFMTKLREVDKEANRVNPEDPDYEKSFKTLMANKEVADTIKQLGSPLAYHTTDVIDATVAWTKEHLADGSLQKMTDLEVIKQAQVMSETYGLTREEMATMSIALAKDEKHPKYEQMMERVTVSRDHMPMDNAEIAHKYEVKREIDSYMSEYRFSAGLGLPAPEENFSPDAIEVLTQQQKDAQLKSVLSQSNASIYQNDLLDKLESTSTREQMHEILGKEKEALRIAGKGENPAGKKDHFADVKLQVVDAVISQAPDVETLLTASKSVKNQIAAIPSKTELTGDAAIAHFIKQELRVASAMADTLVSAYNRNPQELGPQEQIDALRVENKSYKKALIAEKETQVAAFAIRSDKEAWAKVSKNRALAALINQKATQKPTATFAQYQMTMGTPDKDVVVSLLQATDEAHKNLVRVVTNDPITASVLKKKDARSFAALDKYAEEIKKAERISPLNLKGIKTEVKSAFDIALQKKGKEI